MLHLKIYFLLLYMQKLVFQFVVFMCFNEWVFTLKISGQHNHAEEQNVKQSEPIPSPTLIYDDTTGSCGQVNIGSAASHKEPSVREILQLACRVLNESLVRKVDAVYQFQLHGEEGSVYFVDLKHGKYITDQAVQLVEWQLLQ